MGVKTQPQQLKKEKPAKSKSTTGGSPKVASLPSASAFVIKPLPSFKVLKPEDRAAMMEGLAGFKSQIPAVMHDIVAFRRDVAGLSPEEKLGYKDQLDQANGLVADYLNRPGVAGVTAKVAYADALVRTCPEVRGAVVETANELFRIRFVEETSSQRRNAVVVYDRAFTADENLAKISGVAEVMAALAGLVDRTRAAGRKFFEESREALQKEEGGNPLSVDEILSGKDGRRILPIPDQKETVRGEARFYKGGLLLVEITDGEVSVIGAAGGVHRLLDRLAGLSLSVDLLGNEEFKPAERIEDSSEFSSLKLAHRLLRLGLTEGKKEEEKAEGREIFKAEVEAECEALKAKASLTRAEAHIGQLPGTFLQNWGPRFDQRTGRRDKRGEPLVNVVWYPLSLVERNSEGLIRVVEAPERLRGFFAPHMNFAEPGDQYSELGKLGVLLRRDKVRAEAGATPEEQASAAEAKAKADKAKAKAKAKADAEAANKLASELAAGSGEDLTGVNIPPIPSAKESGEERKGLKKTPKPRKR
ncbi:MAG: hypothetical protein HYX21_01835 [Candidatus Yanofskybacteria bacterium]|nr:hypothetical protein [Candidatus Yanofskybacteria bacterium]